MIPTLIGRRRLGIVLPAIVFVALTDCTGHRRRYGRTAWAFQHCHETDR
jgi:hypothetical protein